MISLRKLCRGGTRKLTIDDMIMQAAHCSKSQQGLHETCTEYALVDSRIAVP